MPAAEDLLTLALDRPPTLGRGRLVCIDGPAGSGKTTLAAELAGLAGPAGATVIHLDDLYAGWDGLPHVSDQLATLLRPLAEDRPGRYRRYDWYAGAFAETVTVAPTPLLVVEGVGSGAAAYDDLRTALAWVEAPLQVRKARGLARDGDTFAPHWDSWARAERVLFATERTRERADLVVTTG